MTTTIENAFGSQLMVRGFMLNNQLTDFLFAPSENGVLVANRVEAGKRPRSAMSPMHSASHLAAQFRLAQRADRAGSKPCFTGLDPGLDGPRPRAAVDPQTSGLQGIQRVVKGGYPSWFGGADSRREGVVQGGD